MLFAKLFQGQCAVSYSRIIICHSWSVRRFDIHRISGSLRGNMMISVLKGYLDVVIMGCLHLSKQSFKIDFKLILNSIR